MIILFFFISNSWVTFVLFIFIPTLGGVASAANLFFLKKISFKTILLFPFIGELKTPCSTATR